MIYLITYDLNKSDQNYEELYSSIKQLGNWFHPLDSTWFVSTSLSAQVVYEQLRPKIDSSDFIFVGQIKGNRQGWMPNDFWDWFHKHE